MGWGQFCFKESKSLFRISERASGYNHLNIPVPYLKCQHLNMFLLTDWKPYVSNGTFSKCYGMDCFGAYFTHVQTYDVTRVQSATEWTALVHTLHMSKPVM